jgi:hypothetical protein
MSSRGGDNALARANSPRLDFAVLLFAAIVLGRHDK